MEIKVENSKFQKKREGKRERRKKMQNKSLPPLCFSQKFNFTCEKKKSAQVETDIETRKALLLDERELLFFFLALSLLASCKNLKIIN